MAKAAEKDPNTKLGGVVHDLLDGTRIVRLPFAASTRTYPLFLRRA